jgi:hypothetical protein
MIQARIQIGSNYKKDLMAEHLQIVTQVALESRGRAGLCDRTRGCQGSRRCRKAGIKANSDVPLPLITILVRGLLPLAPKWKDNGEKGHEGGHYRGY